jgi:hypothetical protein
MPIFKRLPDGCRRDPAQRRKHKHKNKNFGGLNMDFFESAVDVLQMLVIAIGAGLAIWGVINLLEGYGQDNPASKSQGMKQLMAGGGIALIGLILVPLLTNVFTV